MAEVEPTHAGNNPRIQGHILTCHLHDISLSHAIFYDWLWRQDDPLGEESRRIHEVGELALSIATSHLELLESPLIALTSDLEFITASTTLEFIRCVHEYNLEWALASYDWSRGREATLLPGLQRAVDESPWGRGG